MDVWLRYWSTKVAELKRTGGYVPSMEPSKLDVESKVGAMTIQDMYAYLMRTRQDLWAALEALPNELLAKKLLHGDESRCIKDLVFHIPSVEDGWIHEDILREAPVLKGNQNLKDTAGGAAYSGMRLSTIIDYWKSVERSTLSYLPQWTGEELSRVIKVHDSPTEHYTINDLLWHVMLHEVRHTAQIVVLLRTQNVKPPSLDLLFYLPAAG